MNGRVWGSAGGLAALGFSSSPLLLSFSSRSVRRFLHAPLYRDCCRFGSAWIRVILESRIHLDSGSSSFRSSGYGPRIKAKSRIRIEVKSRIRGSKTYYRYLTSCRVHPEGIVCVCNCEFPQSWFLVLRIRNPPTLIFWKNSKNFWVKILKFSSWLKFVFVSVKINKFSEILQFCQIYGFKLDFCQK